MLMVRSREDSLLAKYRPDLLHLPTTNGDHTTGQAEVPCERCLSRSALTHVATVTELTQGSGLRAQGFEARFVARLGGDGIKMGEAIGARSIDLEWVQARSAGTSSEHLRVSEHLRAFSVVQVHPTGLVEPDDPEAKIKLLGEVLCIIRAGQS